MASVVLRIEADLCGPVSVGTVGVIRALERHLCLELPTALAWVNRAVFEGETVRIPAPSTAAAEACVRRLMELRTGAKIAAAAD